MSSGIAEPREQASCLGPNVTSAAIEGDTLFVTSKYYLGTGELAQWSSTLA